MGAFGKKREPQEQKQKQKQKQPVKQRNRGLMDPESLRSDNHRYSSDGSYIPPDPSSLAPTIYRISVENSSPPGVLADTDTGHDTTRNGNSSSSSSSSSRTTKTRTADDTVTRSTASVNCSSSSVMALEVESHHAQATTLPTPPGSSSNNSRMPISMRVSKRFSSFAYRVKSFRHDRRAARTDPGLLHGDTRLPGLRPSGTKNHHTGNASDAATVSSGSSRSGCITDDDGNDVDDGSGVSYQQFDIWTSKRRPRTKGCAYANDSVTDHHPCNAYAREQVQAWKAAAVEGPKLVQLAALGLAGLVLSSVVLLAIAAGASSFWTPGGVVAACHLVVSVCLILLFETRSKRTGLMSAACLCDSRSTSSLSSSSSSREDPDDDGLVLPMDLYREYGEYHPRVLGAKTRDEVLQRIPLFRYLYGRGCLFVFAGSMTLAVIPGSWKDHPGPFLTLCFPGLALVIVGLVAIIAGVHASFRWTLLTTSIRCSDEHLLEKFVETRIHSKLDSNSSSSRPLRLDRNEFSVLVTTLGLDLDEIAMIPHVFSLEIMPRDQNGIVFEEFRRWWRGIPRESIRKPRRRHHRHDTPHRALGSPSSSSSPRAKPSISEPQLKHCGPPDSTLV